MSIRPSVRFDVFKRDSFTCSYCGRRSPDVVLEVDHVVPRAEGGTDDMDNLATSCWDCNRGKGAVPLTAAPKRIAGDIEERTEKMQERELQIRAFQKVQRETRDRQNAQADELIDYWFEIWGEESLPHYYIPWRSTIIKYIDLLGPDEVIDAMNIARGKFNHVTTYATKYLNGVLKGKIALLNGTRVTCTVCGNWIDLNEDQDPTIKWRHVSCKKKVA